jgi:hypothetical protein
MENYIILHLMKGTESIMAFNITPDKALLLTEYITDIYINETGSTTIILEIELFNNN